MPNAARELHLLLVEDDPVDLQLMRRALEGQPLTQLDVCESGEAALSYLLRHRPDLVLLDLNLPDVSGYEVLSWLRNSPEHTHTPVVVLSAESGDQARTRAMELEATTFLTKPARGDDLVGVVRAINEFWLHMVMSSPR
ncbi:MAG: response regulator [Myxococcales bacterium]|nr:response regulator [Myxococcales bacterium]